MRNLAVFNKLKEQLLVTDGFVRCLPYLLQFEGLNWLSAKKGFPLKNMNPDSSLRDQLHKEVFQALREDTQNIQNGVYSVDERSFQGPLEYIEKSIKMFLDFPEVIKSREKNQVRLNSDYPDYFSRRFHFQTDGYMSEKSAEIYEHQVEVIFGGLANTMRRMIVEILRPVVSKHSQYKVLELGAGTGISGSILERNFENFEIQSTDLSAEYIEFARQSRSDSQIKFSTEDASKLSYLDSTFDICFHVFLLHEVPTKTRQDILREQIRVLKPGGYGIVLESLQLGDKPHLDEALRDFPKKYHEPFYKSYIEQDLTKQLKDLSVEILDIKHRLLSKAILFKKP